MTFRKRFLCLFLCTVCGAAKAATGGLRVGGFGAGGLREAGAHAGGPAEAGGRIGPSLACKGLCREPTAGGTAAGLSAEPAPGRYTGGADCLGAGLACA